MEALEKDFEDFIDAEEEVHSDEDVISEESDDLSENEIFADDLSEEDLKRIEAFFELEENQDLTEDDIELVLNKDHVLVEIISKKRKTRSQLNKEKSKVERDKENKERRRDYATNKGGVKSKAKSYNKRTKNKRAKFSWRDEFDPKGEPKDDVLSLIHI